MSRVRVVSNDLVSDLLHVYVALLVIFVGVFTLEPSRSLHSKSTQ